MTPRTGLGASPAAAGRSQQRLDDARAAVQADPRDVGALFRYADALDAAHGTQLADALHRATTMRPRGRRAVPARP